MAVEPRRGCGFRRIGGTYLESDPGGFTCGRLPIPLVPCPLCDQRPRFTRGLQRVTPKNLLHSAPECIRSGEKVVADTPFYKATVRLDEGACGVCPYSRIESAEVAGLLWVGARFYSPEQFAAECAELGPSRRVPWPLPKWFELGKTWVFCAHDEGKVESCGACQGKGHLPPMPPEVLGSECESCEGKGEVHTSAIFYAFKPQRVVRIVPDTIEESDLQALREEGLTPVVVDAHDPDHHPTKRDEE